jgi:hypothetical protein
MKHEQQPRRLTTKPYAPDEQGRLYNQAYFAATGRRAYPIDSHFDQSRMHFLTEQDLIARQKARSWRRTDWSSSTPLPDEPRLPNGPKKRRTP